MFLKGRLNTFQKRLFQLLVFLLPTQLGYHLWPDWAFVFGIRIDYLSPTIYLTDVVIFFLLFVWVLSQGKKVLTSINHKPLLVLGAFAAVNILFAFIPQVALLKWIKIVELALLAYLIWVQRRLDIVEDVVKPLSLGMIFFFLLAAAQFSLQSSVGGLFYYFGERTFDASTPGIALYSLFEKLHLRPYSTFSHPNSMAGFAGAAFLFFLGVIFELKKKSSLLLLGIIASFGTVILSGSKTVFGALILILGIYILIRRKLVSLPKVLFAVFSAGIIGSMLLPIVSDAILKKEIQFSERLSQRLVLADLGGRAFSKNPIFGLGLNNFIPSIISLRQTNNLPWILQPVHNIPILVLAETGIVGLGIFAWFIYEFLKKVSTRSIFLGLIIVFIMLTSVLDHYWFTLQQNQLLLVVLSGVMLRQKGKDFLLN